MRFSEPLIKARFLRRRKRFFADIELSDGSQVTAHCPNTGSMLNCLLPDSPCWVSRVKSPAAKLPYRLQIVTSRFGGLAGVNTMLANKLVGEALDAGRIPELAGYETRSAEVSYGKENSRIDWLLEEPGGKCYVEVKNVTLALDSSIAVFPDAVTTRGHKHLRELAAIASEGFRAVLFYCVQLGKVNSVSVAVDIDPLYAEELHRARQQGVEVVAYGATLSPEEIFLQRRLAFS
jgi:sugar fermentation stimulation protein A